MDNEQPHQELVKCVVVGDTAVGKTRLICARACSNSRLDLSQLMTTHIPTVWAIDQYRIHKEVLEKSWEVIDGVNVSLRLWDTFGDHDKDRRFAYGRSDVVLLCFSVANPISLRNCKVVWYPEIRRFCPNTPIVLVGCKNDLRYMFRDEKFLNLCRERSPFFRANHLCSRFPELGRPLKESDILTPEQGRMVSKEIGAPYYESSVFSHHGVNEVFENVIRAALTARKQQRFWMTNLKHVQRASIQEPFCPPQPLPNELSVPESQFNSHLLSVLECQTFTDVVFSFGKSGICAHKFIIAAATSELYKLLTTDLTANNCNNDLLSNSSSLVRSASDSSVASSTETSSSAGNFNADTEQLLASSNNSPAILVDKGHTNRSYLSRASCLFNLPSRNSPCATSILDSCNSNNNSFSNIKRRSSFQNLVESSPTNSSKTGVHKNLNHVLFKSISIENGENVLDSNNDGMRMSHACVQTVVSLSNLITMSALQNCIRFIYSGNVLLEKDTPISELIDVAELLNLTELLKYLKNIENNGQASDMFLDHSYSDEFVMKMKKSLKAVCLDQGLFADVIFQVDDGTCSAHRAILMCRCDMMDAMFRGDFMESAAKIIPFPGVIKETFRHMLYYIYTDSIESSICHSNCLPLLELANRLCMPRLVALIEKQVAHQLDLMMRDKGMDITEIALKLLEQCQLHNADQLADWCLYQISVHYNEICHKNTKLLRSLHPENQAYLNRNRWPPVWYLKEFDFYERCIRERQWQENPPKGLKRHRYNSGCLCFSGKSRKNESKYDYRLK